MSRDDLITSAFGRFVKVGGLLGRVGVSVLGEQAVGLLRDGPTKQLKKADNMIRNAARIAETLGEMKGAAMKVGQMLSLHAGLLLSLIHISEPTRQLTQSRIPEYA